MKTSTGAPNSTKTTAVYLEDHGFVVGDTAMANGLLVSITEIQGRIVHFTPAVEMDAQRGVTLEHA